MPNTQNSNQNSNQLVPEGDEMESRNQKSQPTGTRNADLNIDEVWKIALEQIQLHVSPQNFNAWFKNTCLIKVEGGIATISCASNFAREWIEGRHNLLIQRILQNITKLDLQVIFDVEGAKNSGPVSDDSQSEMDSGSDPGGSSDVTSSSQVTPENRYENMTISPDEATDAPIFNVEYTHQNYLEDAQKKAQLNPTYLYENFVVGPANRLAHAAAESVSEKPGRSYNPLFVYGGSGLGKTHLIQAIGNRVLNADPNKKVLYCSSETFLNEMVAAIRGDKNIEFRQKYRELDVLIIDDIQFMSNWDSAQNELFHTFNTLYQSGRQIVFASDRPPAEIDGIEDRLRSRFEGGMVADITVPDYELRVAIVQEKAQEQEVNLPEYIFEFIAKSFENNIRELEGALLRIATQVKLAGAVPSEEEIAKMLKVDAESKRARVSPKELLKEVCGVFGVSLRDVRGKRRTADVVAPRQVGMYLLRKELDLPLETVAHELNRSDHTTVLHAIERVEERMETDDEFKRRVEGVKV